MNNLLSLTKAAVPSTGTSISSPVDERRPSRGTNAGSVVDWYSADAEMRELRQHNRGQSTLLENGHRGLYTAAISDLAREATKRTARAIVDDLATEFGLAWVDLAKMVGVSVPAIRKWRLDGGVGPENHRRLAEVSAFLRALREYASVQDPAAWISQRMLPGHTVTVRHLYSADRAGLLLDYASGGVSATDVLERTEPAWRVTYATDDDVVIFSDGVPALVRRS